MFERITKNNSGKVEFPLIILSSLLLINCVFHQSNRENPIYTPGKQFVFKTEYFSASEDIIHSDTLKLTVEDGAFMFVQQKIEWHLKMPSADSGTKEIYEYTGVVEKKERLWIHPCRADYLKITELAPFPEVKFPIEIGEQWSSTLNIGPGYGEWSGKKVDNQYRVSRRADTTLNGLSFSDCAVVEGTGTSEPGNTKVSHWFHEKYGFILSDYRLPENERLIISLIEFTTAGNE